jgi:hypothetical protein
MATYSAGVALAFAYEAENGTTDPYTPGGSDRAVFGTIACGGFSGLPSITELRHGGSGGTVIPRVGSDLTWVGGSGSQGVFTIAPGPTGSTTLFGDWASTPLQSAIAAVHYSGVDQTTPFSGHVDATPTFANAVTTTVASVTVTGCTVGQTIVAAVCALSDGVVLSAFTGVAGTTLQVSDVTGTFVGVAMLEKVATGSSETLSVNVNGASSAGLYWSARGARVNDAVGGGEGPVGRSDETDTALNLARLQLSSAGTAAETDTAQALARLQLRATGTAVETDTAQALAARQTLATGQANETDTALALSGLQLRAVGVAVETETAVELARLQIHATGVGAETDTALALDAASGNAVGAAIESDSAFALAGLQLRALGLASETDTALPLLPIQVGSTGVATEADFAYWLAAVQRAAIGRADEIDTAFALEDGSEPAVVVLAATPIIGRNQIDTRTSRVQVSARSPRAQTRTR